MIHADDNKVNTHGRFICELVKIGVFSMENVTARPMTQQPNRLKPLKGDASRIFKLCLEKDINTALQSGQAI